MKKYLLLAVLVIGFIILRRSPLGDYLSFEALRDNREALLAFRDMNYLAAALSFLFVYIAVVAFSLPFASFLTIAGGFLFGYVFGTFFVVLGASLGALCIFIAAKTVLGDILRKKAGPWMAKLEDGFKENAVSYLLFLRLVPLFPFFVVNIVPALFGVRVSVFFLTTFFGIIPGSFVYALTGAGLGSAFDRGEQSSLGGILTPEIIAAFVALGILALVPVVYKKIKAKKS